MNYAQRIASNLAVQLVGRGLMLGTALATLNLVTRRLGTEGFGNYSIALLLVTLVGIVAEMGINVLAVRELAAGAPAAERLGELFGLRLAVAVPLLALVPLVARLVPAYAPEVVRAALALGIAQLLLLGAQLGGAFFQARLRMDLVMASEVLGRVTTLALLWLPGEAPDAAAALDLVVRSVVGGSAVSLLVSAGFLRISGIRFRPVWAPAAWRRTARSALWIGMLSILFLIHFRADSLVLSVLRPAVEVGLYGIAYRIFEILMTFPPMLAGILLPRFVAERANPRTMGILFDKALRVVLAVALPLAVFTGLYAEEIVRVLQGRDGFEPAAQPLRILAAALTPLFTSMLAGMVVVALDRQGRYARRVVLASAISVLLNIALVPRFSYLACAWIALGAEIWIAALGFALLRDILPPLQVVSTLGRAALALVLGAPCAWLLHRTLAPSVERVVGDGPALPGILLLAGLGGVVFIAFAAASLLTGLVHIDDVRKLGSRRSPLE